MLRLCDVLCFWFVTCCWLLVLFVVCVVDRCFGVVAFRVFACVSVLCFLRVFVRCCCIVCCLFVLVLLLCGVCVVLCVCVCVCVCVLLLCCWFVPNCLYIVVCRLLLLVLLCRVGLIVLFVVWVFVR